MYKVRLYAYALLGIMIPSTRRWVLDFTVRSPTTLMHSVWTVNGQKKAADNPSILVITRD